MNHRHRMSKIYSKGLYTPVMYSLMASLASIEDKTSAKRQIIGIQSNRNKYIERRYPNFSGLSLAKLNKDI